MPHALKPRLIDLESLYDTLEQEYDRLCDVQQSLIDRDQINTLEFGNVSRSLEFLEERLDRLHEKILEFYEFNEENLAGKRGKLEGNGIWDDVKDIGKKYVLPIAATVAPIAAFAYQMSKPEQHLKSLAEIEQRKRQQHRGHGIWDDVKRTFNALGAHDREMQESIRRTQLHKGKGKRKDMEDIEVEGGAIWDEVKKYGLPVLGTLGTLGYLYNELKTANTNKLINRRVDEAHQRQRELFGHGLWDDVKSKFNTHVIPAFQKIGDLGKKYALPALSALAVIAPYALVAHQHYRNLDKNKMISQSEGTLKNLANNALNSSLRHEAERREELANQLAREKKQKNINIAKPSNNPKAFPNLKKSLSTPYGTGFFDDVVSGVKKYALPVLGTVAPLAGLAGLALSNKKKKGLSLPEMENASENILGSLNRANKGFGKKKYYRI